MTNAAKQAHQSTFWIRSPWTLMVTADPDGGDAVVRLRPSEHCVNSEQDRDVNTVLLVPYIPVKDDAPSPVLLSELKAVLDKLLPDGKVVDEWRVSHMEVSGNKEASGVKVRDRFFSLLMQLGE